MHAWGACGPGSTPGSPTLFLFLLLFFCNWFWLSCVSCLFRGFIGGQLLADRLVLSHASFFAKGLDTLGAGENMGSGRSRGQLEVWVLSGPVGWVVVTTQ